MIKWLHFVNMLVDKFVPYISHRRNRIYIRLPNNVHKL